MTFAKYLIIRNLLIYLYRLRGFLNAKGYGIDPKKLF